MPPRVKNVKLWADDPRREQKLAQAAAELARQGQRVESVQGPLPLESGELMYAIILEPAGGGSRDGALPGMWQCPDCGEMMPDDDRVCSICLARRPGS